MFLQLIRRGIGTISVLRWPQDGIGICKALRTQESRFDSLEVKLNKILKRLDAWHDEARSPVEHRFSDHSQGGRGSPMMSRLEENVSFAPDITVISVPFAAQESSVSLLSAGKQHRQQSEQSSTSQEMEDAPQRRRRTSLLVPRKGAKSRSIYANVDAVTWTAQLKADWKNPAEGAKRAAVPSIQKMDAAFMRAISNQQQLLPLSAGSFRGIAPGDNLAALRVPAASDTEEIRLEASESRENLAATSLDRDGRDEAPNLPGALNTLSVSKAGTTLSIGGAGEKKKSSTVMSLSKDSQANILDQYHEPSFLSPEPAEIHDDYGSSILLALPRALCPLLGFLTLCYCSTMLGLLILGWLQGNTFQITMVSIALYSGAAIGCTLFLRHALQTDELTLALGKLHLFVADLSLEWSKVSGQEWRKNALTWLCIVFFFAASQVLEEFRPMEISASADHPDAEVLVSMRRALSGLSLIIFAISSGLVILGASVLSHILMGLDKSLDCWCCILLEEADFVVGVQSWNCLQALLKCIGRELGNAFVMAQALGAVGFVYFLASGVTNAFQKGFRIDMLIFEMVAALPLLFLFAVNMRVCAHGAALTEKCRQIPAFVNQIPSPEPIDTERSYLVHFITDSSAGFFVKDARLTRE
ncbi:unnamed protein product, partial [Symbiodinium sp. CCMP2456]